MTNAPNSEPTPNPPDRQSSSMRRKILLAVGSGLLLSIAGGATYGWFWVRNRLAPLIERELTQLLDRPVQLGRLERISLDSVRFGSSAIPATPTDSDRLTTRAVEVQFSPTQLLFNRTLQLNVTLIQPNAYLEQSPDGEWVNAQIESEEGGGFLQTELQTIRFREASIVLNPAARPRVPRGLVRIQPANGLVRFFEESDRIPFEAEGQVLGSGNLRLTGEFRPDAEQTDLRVRGQNLAAIDISRIVELPVAFLAGRASGDITVNFLPDQPADIFGQVRLNQVTADIANLPQRFTNGQGQLRFQEQFITFDRVNVLYGTVPVQVNGNINTESSYNLSGIVPSVSAQNVLNTLQLESPFAVQATLQANLQLRGALDQPVLTGAVRTVNTAQVDRIPFRSIRTQFQLTTGDDSQLTFAQIEALPQAGGQVRGNGRILLAQSDRASFQFQALNLPGDAIAQLYNIAPDVRIGSVAATAQIFGRSNNLQTVVQFQAPDATYATTGEVSIANDGQVQVRDATLRVAGGTVRLRGNIVEQQFTAIANASQIPLTEISPDLRGTLSANLQLAGNTNALELANIQAAGQVRLSEGIAIVQRPIDAQVEWNGQQLLVQRATSPGLTANGIVEVNTATATGTPEIRQYDLNVQTQNYNFQDLALDLPDNLAIAGLADFNGRVTGAPGATNAQGTLQAQNLLVNGLPFETALAGQLNFTENRQTNIQLAGNRDRLDLTLNAANQPTDFFIQRERSIARGRSAGETLLVDVQNFPVAQLNAVIPEIPLDELQPVGGDLTGNLAINFEPLTITGTVTIANPQLGRIVGDTFRGEFRFANGITTLTAGELQQDETRIAVSGTLQPDTAQPFAFQVNFDRANIASVLQSLNVFDFQDIATGFQPPQFGNAADLPTTSIDIRNQSLERQLQRFSEILALVAQEQTQQAADPVPTLADLQGQVSGTVALTGTPNDQFNASFDLQGQNWQWGEYQIETAIATGNFTDGALTLLPLRVEFDRGLLSFSGRLGQEQLSGQLIAQQLPVELLRPFIQDALPVNVDGDLNANATLTGSVNNPNVIGEIVLVNGQLNEQPIQQAQALFSYNNARLNFNSNALITGTEPIAVSGSIPIALPFTKVQPASNAVSLNARVRNNGLALINIFTDQFTWVNGRGQLDVAVAGTLDQPIVEGNLTVQNATVRSAAIPEPLTNVTGTAQFNGDRVIVQTLQAQYNRDRLTAQGILPIFASADAVQQAATNPLSIAFNNLTLNLDNLYQGDVSGNALITGTALSPRIGGVVQLSDGQVFINQSSDVSLTSSANDALLGVGSDNEVQSETSQTTSSIAAIPFVFDDLQIVLEDDVRVVSQPILSFIAEGNVTLNGTLADPRPNGVIRLTGGQINLFTTQFRLARGFDQTATFLPEQGFDPTLNVRLLALVPEVVGTQTQTTTTAFPNEITNEVTLVQPSAFSRLQTVRVEAIATGRASDLSQNLQLTSSPLRSEAEIVALIGGNFFNALEADPALGIANIASSVLFSNFQESITAAGRSIGLSELRIAPTLIPETRRDDAELGLEIEGVVDVTNNFSVSVAGIVGAVDPVRYNVIYRVNDRIRVQASSNFSGESRAAIEYEARF